MSARSAANACATAPDANVSWSLERAPFAAALSLPSLSFHHPLLFLFEGLVALSARDELAIWLVLGLASLALQRRTRSGRAIGRRQTALLSVISFTTLLTLAQYLQGILVQLLPSWWWHPFARYKYRSVQADELEGALAGHCVGEGGDMCLSEEAWSTLGSGALSSRRPEDVRGVEAGARVAAASTLVVAALARNVADAIVPFRRNMEALLPFYRRVPAAAAAAAASARRAGRLPLETVVFENDSTDGTREAVEAWAREAPSRGYAVRLVECEGRPGCRLRHGSWYTSARKQHQLAAYRNLLLAEVLRITEGDATARLLVMDVDLGVSLSPLGIIHTLGVAPHAAVAASGRSPKPMTLGSLVTPYDIAAFRAEPSAPTASAASSASPASPFSSASAHPAWDAALARWHEAFCVGVGRGGDAKGWDRATCDFASPFHVAAVLGADRSHRDGGAARRGAAAGAGEGAEEGEEQQQQQQQQQQQPPQGPLYRVVSAFNGAVLYPVELLRLSGATYDASGNRTGTCEHIPFHEAIRAGATGGGSGGGSGSGGGAPSAAEAAGYSPSMLVSPRWAFYVHPTRPPGPTGAKFLEVMNNQGGVLNAQVAMVLLAAFVTRSLVGAAVVGTLHLLGGAGGAACRRLHRRAKPKAA